MSKKSPQKKGKNKTSARVRAPLGNAGMPGNIGGETTFTDTSTEWFLYFSEGLTYQTNGGATPLPDLPRNVLTPGPHGRGRQLSVRIPDPATNPNDRIVARESSDNQGRKITMFLRVREADIP